MILTTAVFLSGLGFAAWLLGSVLDMPGVAVIGGVLILGVGVVATDGGLQHKSGELRENTTANQTDIQYQYDDIHTPSRFSLGYLVMLLGGALSFHALNNATDSNRL